MSERRDWSQACWTGAPVETPFLSVHLFSWQWNRARLLNSESALGTQGYAGVRDQLSECLINWHTHTATPGPEAGVSCERVSYYSSNSNARSNRFFLLVLEVLVLSILSIHPCTTFATDICLSLLPLKQEVSLVENLSWEKYLSTSHLYLSAFSNHLPLSAMQLANTRCYRCYQVKRLKICCHMSMSLIVQDICMCWFQ